MKYKLYYNGSSCIVKGLNNQAYAVNLQKLHDGISVLTGGDYTLPNGDILHINEKDGPIEYWGSEINGIEITLDSGREFIAYLSTVDGNYAQESGVGIFYDLQWKYDEYNILRIYYIDDIYEGFHNYCETEARQAGTFCCAFVIMNGYWAPTTNTTYLGNTVTLLSGENVWVSGPTVADCYDEAGVCFDRSTGAESFGYYYRDGELLQETYNFWFGNANDVCAPQNGDTIAIYTYTEDAYEYAQSESDFSEETISEYAPLLCKLRFNSSLGLWEIYEDASGGATSCSIRDGGSIALPNGDILYINEQYGDLSPWSYGGDEGVGMYLDSGHNMIIYADSSPNGLYQESGFGVIYDVWYEYDQEEVVYRIYDIDPDDRYSGISYSSEGRLLSYPHWTLILRDDEWVLTGDPYYAGYTITLRSGEKVIVLSDGVAYGGEFGVCFALNSGHEAMGYYYRNGQMICETCNFGFGSDIDYARNGDIIHIYDLGEDNYETVIENHDYHESNVARYVDLLCVLQHDGHGWVLLEDYS